MPLAIACPKCKKKYDLPDKFLGKPVKCTECATQFQVPAGKGKPKAAAKASANPRAAANQQAAAKRKQAQAAAQQKAKELQQLGVDGPIRRAPDVFDGLAQAKGTADPLANHLIEDPGFGEASVKRKKSDINETADPMAGMFENPALAAPKKKRMGAKGKKKSKGGFGDKAWLWFMVVFTPALLLPSVLNISGVVSLETASRIAAISSGAFWFAWLAGKIWGVKLTYQSTESVLHTVLTALIPFYAIYPIVTHWEKMKSYAYLYIAPYAMFLILIIVAVILGLIVGFGSVLLS